MRFNGHVRAMMATIGAPAHTPRAYAEIKYPACGIVTLKSVARYGNMPIMTYSATPKPNVPKARAVNAFFIFFVCFLRLVILKK